jgi:hypothetical protein
MLEKVQQCSNLIIHICHKSLILLDNSLLITNTLVYGFQCRNTIQQNLRLTAMSSFLNQLTLRDWLHHHHHQVSDIGTLIIETDDLKKLMRCQPKKIIMNFVAMKASRHGNVIDLFATMLSGSAYMHSLWNIDAQSVVKLRIFCSAERT